MERVFVCGSWLDALPDEFVWNGVKQIKYCTLDLNSELFYRLSVEYIVITIGLLIYRKYISYTNDRANCNLNNNNH